MLANTADAGPREEVDTGYLRYLQDQASLEGGNMVQPPDFKGLWKGGSRYANRKVQLWATNSQPKSRRY